MFERINSGHGLGGGIESKCTECGKKLGEIGNYNNWQFTMMAEREAAHKLVCNGAKEETK